MAPIIHTSSFLSCRYIVSCFKNNTHDFCIKVVRNLPWNILQCLLGAFAFILSCGSVEPLDPTGIAVWADDCSEIACAVNKADFDGGMFANHETNERYDLVLYDSEGNREGTILSNRKVDGFTSSVESIYYMKSRGYLLVETLMYNCGGRLYEKISLEGENSRLFHLDCEKITDKVKMVPSWL